MIVCLPVPCSSLFPASDSPQSNILSSPKAGRIAPSIQSLLPCTAPLKPLWVSIRTSAISIVLPQWGHLPTATSQGLSLLFVEEFQCFADSKKIKQREDGMFPSCGQRTWSFTLELFYFLWRLREMHSLLFCNCLPVPDCVGLSPHVLICSLEVSDNKENCLWYIVVEENQTVPQW